MYLDRRLTWTKHIETKRKAMDPNLRKSETLRLMLDAPWYVTNAAIDKHLEIDTVKKTIERYSEHYEERLRTHLNKLATNLLNRNLVVRRLKRF